MDKDAKIDMKLYKDYLNGDTKAFELLYLKYKDRIKYFVYNIVKDYEKAEDITQDTFVYVLNNKVKEDSSFKCYLYMIAKSRAVNHLNKETKKHKIEEYLIKTNEQASEDVLEIIAKQDEKKKLMEAIKQLDNKYKNAIYLVKIEGLSYKETAEILGESLGNIKTLIHRGKKQLRKLLIAKGFNEMNKASKVIVIVLLASIMLSGVALAGVTIYNQFIKQKDEVNSRGLFDTGNGITTYEVDLMANDMTWNAEPRLYHRIITNMDDYNKYKSRVSQLPDMVESDFNENFLVIVANENVRQRHEKDMTIYKVEADDTTTHITMKQKENPNYENDSNIWYAIVNKSQLRDSADVQIEQHRVSTDQYARLEDLPKDYTVEQAISDGCIVTVDNRLVSNNLDVLDSYVDKTKNGEAAYIRVYRKYANEIEINDFAFENGIYYQTRDATRNANWGGNGLAYGSFTGLEKVEHNQGITYSLKDEDNPYTEGILVFLQKYEGTLTRDQYYAWFYANSEDEFYGTKDGGKTFNQIISLKKAYEIAKEEVKKEEYITKSFGQGFSGELSKDYYDHLNNYYKDLIVLEKGVNSDYLSLGDIIDESKFKNQLVWEVTLGDNIDPLTSISLYIDATTGEVLGSGVYGD